jgi:hypothetical protein
MARTLTTIAIMLLAQPLLLLVSAHLFPGSLRYFGWSAAVLVIATLAAAIALLTSGWSRQVKLFGGITYLVLAAVSAPYVGLWAVCSAGDCL